MSCSEKIELKKVVIKSNTGADAIKRAPIVEEDTGVRCLRIGDISNNRPFEEWGFTNANLDVVEKFQLKKDDIVIARTGNTIGVVKYISNDVKSVYNNGLIRIKIGKDFNPKFIYYNLISEDFKSFIYGISAGTSTQPNMKIDHMLQYKISDFNIDEQEKIANILSSLDDKIELNNEMNKTLEDMAKSIFKRWFIDFEFPNEDDGPYKSSGGEMVESELGMIPKGWEVKELGEVININPRESLKKGEEKIYVEMANLPLNYARVINYIEKPFSGGTKFRNGDTLLARITPCLENGKTAIVDFLEENDLAFGSTEYIVMRPKVLNQYYIYCLARDEDFRNYAIKNMNGSSGRQRVDANTIKQYIIPCPDKDTLELFNQFCIGLFNQMKENDYESTALSAIRYTLLPKLMSGYTRVQHL